MLVCSLCGSTYTRSQEFCGLDGTPLGTLDPLPLIDRLIDRYRIVDVIGSGGMAMVYRALHTRLEKHFAFKALHGQMASDQMLAKRFHREAKVLSRLNHPNIVAVSDFGSTEHGVPYMVMELLEGESLWTRSRERGPIPPGTVAEWTLQIASGLAIAHRKGFVHRDLKPQNIMLVPDPGKDGEQIKILDFGLVGIMEPDPGQHTQLTQEGMFFGTPAYMSPEQITGGEVKATADLYALGVLMYLLLTGEVPFRGDVRELAHQHVSSEPSRPLLEYGGLTPIVMRLLEKDPKRRLPNARALMRAIDETGLLGRSLDLGPSSSRDTRVDRQSPLQFSDADDGPELTFGEPNEIEVPKAPSPPARPSAGATWWWASGAVVLATVLALRFGWDRVLPGPKVEPVNGSQASALEGEPPKKPKAERAQPKPAPKPKPRPKAAAAATDPPDPNAKTTPTADRIDKPPSQPPPSTEGTTDSRALFESLDQALTAEITAQEVAWSDVEAQARRAAFRWGAWYRDPTGADPAAMRRIQAELMATVARLGAEIPKRDGSARNEKEEAGAADQAAQNEPVTAPSEASSPQNETPEEDSTVTTDPTSAGPSQNETKPSQSETDEGEAPEDGLDPPTEDALDRSLKKLQTDTSSRP
ncbi:MAG: protein kinase [Myxococcota bacterium]